MQITNGENMALFISCLLIVICSYKILLYVHELIVWWSYAIATFMSQNQLNVYAFISSK